MADLRKVGIVWGFFVLFCFGKLFLLVLVISYTIHDHIRIGSLRNYHIDIVEGVGI